MISVDEALAAIRQNARPLGSESVSLSEAAGRVLAREIRSDVDWPPFDTSAMDGYAVRAEDAAAAGGTLLERAGLVAAGDPPPSPIRAGEAVRIMTGAPLPERADAVVPVERSRREGGRVCFDVLPERGAHVRRRGESVAAGSVLVEAGRRLAPADIALAALSGADPIAVYRRPRILIAPTGNELIPAGGRPRPGQVRDSNGPMLLSLCRRLNWPATLLQGIPDERPKIEGLFAGATEACDVLLTCGGVSAGDLDLLPDIASSCGFELVFAGVSVRPGKPVVLSRRGGTLWFGLPGNPVSSSVTFQLFAREGLSRLEGDRTPGAPRVTARLAIPLKRAGSREAYRDGFWTIESGENRVEPIASRGSHDIAAHARANVLIRTAAGSPDLSDGAVVECLVL